MSAAPRTVILFGLLIALFVGHPSARAQDTLSLAIGQRGAWDTSVAELGQRAGIFARHGLELEIVYTQGGGETMQPVISGAVDIGVGPSVMAVLGAYSRGAPIRIIGVTATGARDLFWYVRADSPLRTLADVDGETIAYSTTGSSSHEIVKAFMAENGISAEPTATGSPPSTLTQVMAGLIDIGWAAVPFGLEQLEREEIRVLAGGDDAVRFRDQTVRVLVTNARTFQSEPEKFERFMRAYRETVDWMYHNPEAIPTYAEFVGISEALALRVRDEFFPMDAINPDAIRGLDDIIPTARELGYINESLDDARLNQLIQIPPRN
jgi:NitT/TauT family transport system substrate-binding protein